MTDYSSNYGDNDEPATELGDIEGVVSRFEGWEEHNKFLIGEYIEVIRDTNYFKGILTAAEKNRLERGFFNRRSENDINSDVEEFWDSLTRPNEKGISELQILQDLMLETVLANPPINARRYWEVMSDGNLPEKIRRALTGKGTDFFAPVLVLGSPEDGFLDVQIPGMEPVKTFQERPGVISLLTYVANSTSNEHSPEKAVNPFTDKPIQSLTAEQARIVRKVTGVDEVGAAMTSLLNIFNSRALQEATIKVAARKGTSPILEMATLSLTRDIRMVGYARTINQLQAIHDAAVMAIKVNVNSIAAVPSMGVMDPGVKLALGGQTSKYYELSGKRQTLALRILDMYAYKTRLICLAALGMFKDFNLR